MHRAVGRGPFRAARHLREAEPRDPAPRIDRGRFAIRPRAPARSPSPAAASPRTSSGSADQKSRRSARGGHARAPRPSPFARALRDPRTAPGYRRDSRPRGRSDASHCRDAAARARTPEDAARVRARRRRARLPRRGGAVSVTPTISQCQSNAAAAAHAAERAKSRSGEPRVVARGRSERRAGATAPHEQREPDEAELGERLHVERVRIANDEEVGSPLVPEVLERARAVPDERTLASCVPGDAKLLAPARCPRC